MQSGNTTTAQRLHSAGFTLVEMLVTVTVILILLAIAIPVYSSFMMDSRRSDAIGFLSELAGEQQRYMSENSVYASSMEQLGYGEDNAVVSPQGHYTVSVATPDSGTSYLFTATPVVGTSQENDSQCKSFTLSSSGAKKNTSGATEGCW